MEKMSCCRRDRWKLQVSAEQDGRLEVVSRRQLNIEILLRCALPGSECRLAIGQNNKTCSMLRNRGDEMKRVLAVASRQDAAEVGIACRALREQDGTITPRNDFS